uniref:Protein SPEC3 n=1 Tax=Strigamia maritima TaxID=126957 RepID=T1JGT2_STRMM
MAAEVKASRSDSSAFEIIGVRDRHGQFRKAVPTMPLPLAIVCCVLNVFLPGTGTLVSAFAVWCHYATEYENKSRAFANNVLAAFLQVLTLVIIVGYIWSILWGVTFVTLSISKRKQDAKEVKEVEAKV